MEDPRVLRPLPRAVEIGTGLVITVVSGALLVAAVNGLAGQARQSSPHPAALIIFVAFLIAGFFCLYLGWRLLSSKPSRGGGSLLSPFGWHATGWAFIVFGLGFFVARQWVGVLFAGILALWCFLAARLPRPSTPTP